MTALTEALTTTKGELADRRRRLDQRIGQARATAERAKAAQVKAATAEDYAEACEEASRLLASYADERQAKVISSIEAIVSAGLTSVFAEPVELHLNQVTRGRRPEIDITVRTGELETPVMDARGGGLAQVAGLLLKVTTLLLTRGARRLIVADEPLGMLSADYAPRVADFLAELCEKTDTQLIMITHDDAFAEAADRVIRLKTANGAATATVEK